jgi:DNA-directed RNA polymerase subunit RPC12/RpoP
MADLPKDNESTLNPQRTEETHKPARGAAGGRHQPESKAEAGRRGDHSGDPAADRRQDKEASGDALRRQMASPVIESVTTMVCVTCGAEQFFDGQVPAALKCQRCGSMVFRAFDTPTRRDEATIAHLEEEARSLQYGDDSPQTAPEEVRDLEMK